MKKTFFTVCLVLFSMLILNAQKKDLRETLTSKVWKVDIEVMKDDFQKSFENDPEFKSLSKDEKEQTVLSIVTAFTDMKFEFYENDSFKVIIPSIVVKGKYTIVKKENRLLLDYNEEKTNYKIIAVDSNKIQLESIEDKSMFVLIPYNN